MKNYLVMTIGTRDVQLRRDLVEQSGKWAFDERLDLDSGKKEKIIIQGDHVVPYVKNQNENYSNYLLIPPRKSAKIIYNELHLFLPFIEFPLMGPLMEEFKLVDKKIDYILLVYTDQEKEFLKEIVSEYYYNNDTLFFKDILKSTLTKEFPEAIIDEYGIVEQVVNIDYQYRHFAEKKQNILGTPYEEIKEILLLPQGGIDQINQAITLQLIQAFGHKVKLYQQAEETKPTQLKFTHYFLNDLINHQVLALVESGNFNAALELRKSIQMYHPTQYDLQNKLLLFAHYRFSLLYEETKSIANELIALGVRDLNILSTSQTLSNYQVLPDKFDLDIVYKMGELLEKSRYFLKIGNVGESVLFYYVHIELILNGCLDAYFGTHLSSDHQSHQKKALQCIEDQYPNIYAKYKKKNRAGNVFLTSPIKIDVVLAESKPGSDLNLLLKKVGKHVDTFPQKGQLTLNDARNKYAHEGRFIQLNEVPYFPELVNQSVKMLRFETEDKFTRLIEFIGNNLKEKPPYA